jgi:hypothetical protein
VTAQGQHGCGTGRQFLDIVAIYGGNGSPMNLTSNWEKRPSISEAWGTGSITAKGDMIVLNGDGSKDSIRACCEQIKALIVDPTTTKLQERLVNLSGGVAIIRSL